MKAVYTASAEKDFRSLPRAVQKRIAQKMRFYLSQENPLKFAKSIKDSRLGSYSFRVGDYRVVFDVQKDRITVLRVRKRDEVYD